MLFRKVMTKSGSSNTRNWGKLIGEKGFDDLNSEKFTDVFTNYDKNCTADDIITFRER